MNPAHEILRRYNLKQVRSIVTLNQHLLVRILRLVTSMCQPSKLAKSPAFLLRLEGVTCWLFLLAEGSSSSAVLVPAGCGCTVRGARWALQARSGRCVARAAFGRLDVQERIINHCGLALLRQQSIVHIPDLRTCDMV